MSQFDGLTAIGSIGTIFLLISAILAFCIPFFIYRIRNEVIKMRIQLENIASSLNAHHIAEKPPLTMTDDEWLKDSVKCISCGHQNIAGSIRCIHCGSHITTV